MGWKRAIKAALALWGLGWALSAPLSAQAATYYVAPGGSDQNPGTQERPFASMAKGQAAAGPGDTVYFRGGTYKFNSSTAADGVMLDKSGQSGKRINYWAYGSEKPVFDFAGMTAKQRITGIRVKASWVHLKGIEIKNVPQRINTANESWGVYVLGSSNVFEKLDMHHISGPGLFIGGGSNNLVLNCDSHHNYDPLSKAGAGENADGFGCHSRNGSNNVFRGCRAWWNTDDGYDFISATGVCIVEKSWAFYNGYMPGTFEGKKNGNGFKAGGYGSGTVPAKPPRHTVRNCLAFRNRAAGFYQNHHPIGGDWFNNTGYKNARDFDMLVLEGSGISSQKLRNNVGYGSSQVIANFKGRDDSYNSWKLGVSVSDADFQSVDMKGVDGPRKPDGSLPDIAFMKLRSGSDLIDRGQNVGLPFAGKAPDLGWLESGTAAATTVSADVPVAHAESSVPDAATAAEEPSDEDLDVDVEPSDSEPAASEPEVVDADGGCSALNGRDNLSGAALLALMLGLSLVRRRRKG